MDLLVAGVDPDDVIDEVASVLRRARVSVRRRGEAELRTEEGLHIRLLTPSMLDRAAERYALDNALHQPALLPRHRGIHVFLAPGLVPMVL